MHGYHYISKQQLRDIIHQKTSCDNNTVFAWLYAYNRQFIFGIMLNAVMVCEPDPRSPRGPSPQSREHSLYIPAHKKSEDRLLCPPLWLPLKPILCVSQAYSSLVLQYTILRSAFLLNPQLSFVVSCLAYACLSRLSA